MGTPRLALLYPIRPSMAMVFLADLLYRAWLMQAAQAGLLSAHRVEEPVSHMFNICV